MPILASESLRRENKKSNNKMLPSESWTTGLGFQVKHPSFSLDLGDLVRINRAWLYKDSKVLALQAIAQLG